MQEAYTVGLVILFFILGELLKKLYSFVWRSDFKAMVLDWVDNARIENQYKPRLDELREKSRSCYFGIEKLERNFDVYAPVHAEFEKLQLEVKNLQTLLQNVLDRQRETNQTIERLRSTVARD